MKVLFVEPPNEQCARARTLEIAKRVSPKVLTVTGGQHFTAMSQETWKIILKLISLHVQKERKP